MCEYNLDKWRRILPNMKPKVFIKPPEYYAKKELEAQKAAAAKRKKMQDSLIKLVGKMHKGAKEKIHHGLVNSDDESTNVYIDPAAGDTLYKSSKSSSKTNAGTLKAIIGNGTAEEMTTYSVYNNWLTSNL